MEIRQQLSPGQHGTLKWTRRFGKRLVCVRYRCDHATRTRFTTVELIVEARPWHAPDDHPDVAPPGGQSAPASPVAVQVHYHERELRERIKRAGARWLAEQRLWLIDPETVRALNLTERVVKKITESG